MTDKLFLLAHQLTEKISQAENKKTKKLKKLGRRASELKEKIDNFKQTQNLLSDL